MDVAPSLTTRMSAVLLVVKDVAIFGVTNVAVNWFPIAEEALKFKENVEKLVSDADLTPRLQVIRQVWRIPLNRFYLAEKY